jgi:hypothetical protein
MPHAMARRGSRTLAIPLILNFLLVGSALAEAIPRDWQTHPAIVVAAIPKDLYALGDVHGDYEKMVELLSSARLIGASPSSPQAVEWTAGPAVLVVTGDMIDKYNNALGVLNLLRTLQPLAERAGGRVIVTLGNHEAEFLASDGGGKKSTEFAIELQSSGLQPSEVAAGTDAAGVGVWMRDLPMGAKVGDWFFCHAGDTGGLSVAQLDSEMQTQVGQMGFACPILQNPTSPLQARMHPRPWWDWDGHPIELHSAAQIDAPGLPAPVDDEAAIHQSAGEKRLRSNIAALGAHHLVFGHQPGQIRFSDGSERPAGEMFQKYDGLVFLIDTGMSRGVDNGRSALLHVVDGSAQSASAIYADGTVRPLLP